MQAQVQNLAQLYAFRNDARLMLGGLGCKALIEEAVLLALTELGTNLIQHGGGGTLSITVVQQSSRFVRVESTNVVSEEQLGSESSGLGMGLSTLDRLMDRVSIARTGEVLRVVAELELDRESSG